MPDITPYRPCGYCADRQIRNRQGIHPAAVAQVEVWEAERFHGRHYLCEQHFRQVETRKDANGWTVHVTERGMTF